MLIKGFLVEQERSIRVKLGHWWADWTEGVVLTLDEADMKEVDIWRKMKKAKNVPASRDAVKDPEV
jgi:hypothetical protein